MKYYKCEECGKECPCVCAIHVNMDPETCPCKAEEGSFFVEIGYSEFYNIIIGE